MGIEEGMGAQSECLEKIGTQNEVFVASKESDAAQTEREQMLHVLNETCVKYKDNERHLKEGLKFYQDLMADYVLPLKDEIDNFCAARESERDLLLADLGQNVQKLGIDTTAAAQAQSEQKVNEPVQQPQPQSPLQPQQAQQQPPAQAQGFNPNYQPPPSAQAPANGYNPYYSQQPPPQQAQYQQPPQQQQPAQYQQPPQGQYGQAPAQQQQGYAPQQQPQYAPQYQQPPPQQQYAPPAQQQGYQQPYQQQPPQGYNPNYQQPPNNANR